METETSNNLVFIRETMEPLLSMDERRTFTVREGVTFKDYEIFLGERVGAIDSQSFTKKRTTGSAGSFILGLLENLRNKKIAHRCPTCGRRDDYYCRKDVLREIHWYLSQAIAVGGKKYEEIPTEVSDLQEEIDDMLKYLQQSVLMKEKKNIILDSPIEELPLPTRCIYTLQDAGIKTIRELTQKTEEDLRDIERIGANYISRIRDELERKGLKLGKRE